jgi:glycosyltransferase involved in cell wall biosynthesis
MNVDSLLDLLRSEPIHTWFDLTLFIDRFREKRGVPSAEFPGFFEDFRESILRGGIGFVNFDFGIDGVTMEAVKYAKSFQRILPGVPVHFIAGEFKAAGAHLLENYERFTVPQMSGFDRWPLYKKFFQTKLERGSPAYNSLIHKYWDEVLDITEHLGRYIEERGINLLFLLNVCSNPGNVSLSLAMVFLSEALGIPVVNNSHDYYWEGGNRKEDILKYGLSPGPRDFFFTNSDVGEFFSIIDVLFPWDSRSWLTVNINKNQCRQVVTEKGHNPANVCDINTAVDVEAYQGVSKAAKMRAFSQIADILSLYGEHPEPLSPDALLDSLERQKSTDPVLVGEGEPFPFVSNNIVFLQPTRVMRRKRIEIGFQLIAKLFGIKSFATRFEQNPKLRLTLLATGPIAAGHRDYFKKLVSNFGKLLAKLPKAYRGRVFLGFLFSEFDRNRFLDRYDAALTIPEIYSLASLVLLPSETEGRGLPIIESAASGVAILCSRYYPTNVYDEVIGTQLREQDRLRVFEFEGRSIEEGLVRKIADWVFFPQFFVKDIEHNRRAVQKRFSLDALAERIEEIFFRVYQQSKPNRFSMQRVADILANYKRLTAVRNADLRALIRGNRHYLPGYGRLAYMLFLKSLIDPSYFRVEKQRIRGMAMGFAQELAEQAEGVSDEERLHRFFNTVDNVFLYQEGEVAIRHDHSFAYRHRNRKHYPYQDFTQQELTGLINMLFSKIVSPQARQRLESIPHLFTDWDLALLQLINSPDLAIDDRARLRERLERNVPFALFPGRYVRHELEYFALYHVRAQLPLDQGEPLSPQLIGQHREKLAPVYIFCPEKPLGDRITYGALKSFVDQEAEEELRILFKRGICRLVKTDQWCVGVHLPQLGPAALKALREVRRLGGYLLASDDEASLMTDIVDMDRFHIGRVKSELPARIMGLPVGSGYIQFVPAGVRTTLAYPTPIQTAKSFSVEMKSPLYRRLAGRMGEEKLLGAVREDAENRGSPLRAVLAEAERKRGGENPALSRSYLSGVYKDGLPWNGAIASVKISRSKRRWRFAVVAAGAGRKTVTAFIDDFERDHGKKVGIAWNGGYMLNAELVGKLGLPESYIGSPLGLIISDGEVLCPPLFNKPAFFVYPDGHLDIKRVHCRDGMEISDGRASVRFPPGGLNPKEPVEGEPCYYDLFYSEETIPGRGRVLVRLAGNIIKQVIHSAEHEDVPVLPVGLVLSLPASLFPPGWDEVEKVLAIKMTGWGEISYAIEAGPQLVEDGVSCIDMDQEGMTTINSIKTQAARLDFTDMRGPKIAIGLDTAGDLSVLAINGRIRESVGATHGDMADILIAQGMSKAMGFDPGGSSTLIASGRVLNISPFNSAYENDVLSLPPEPRPVGNAVLGWQD